MRKSDPGSRRNPPLHGLTPRLTEAYGQALAWLRRGDVVGVFVGPKYRGEGLARRRVGNGLCINVMVRKKKDLNELRIQSRFPTSIDGVPVDVIEGGADLVPHLHPGSRISESDSFKFGTLGLFVQHLESDQRCLLTAGHVCDGTSGRILMAGGTQVAREIVKVIGAKGDGALASLNLPADVPEDPVIQQLGFAPRDVARAEQGDILSMYGATSKRVTATVHRAGQFADTIGGIKFSCRVLELTPIKDTDPPPSREGDSGAVWVNEDTQMAVGLNVVGGTLKSGEPVAYACDLAELLIALGAQFPP